MVSNGTVQVTFTVCNKGDSGGDAPLTLYRSTDQVINTSDVAIASLPWVGYLAAGTCVPWVMTANIGSVTGTFYLGIYVDPGNAVVEGSETNNTLAAAKPIGVGSKPDLIVTSVSGPPSALPSTSFSVTATLCNQGTTSGSASVTLYLSSDSNINASDTQVGVLAAPPSLAPGACATLTGNATAVPASAVYWLGAIADRANLLSELIENNNTTLGTQMGLGSKPDFILTSVSGPPSAGTGSSFPVTAVLCNQGTISGTAPVTLYLSADATITSADLQVGVLSAPPSLSPGACATLTGNATAPATGAAYYVGAFADRANAVSETMEVNNTRAGGRIGIGNAPDLYVTSVSTAPSAVPGGMVTVTATVCNQGTQDGNGTAGVYFSADATITTADFFAGVFPVVPWLKAGACDVVSGTFSVPATAGTYFAGVIADSSSSTAETLEDNNALAGTRVGVGYAPDLVVTAVSTAPSVVPGQPVTAFATVCNQGTSTGNALVTLYFSTDATITTADLMVGDLPSSWSLQPGACDTQSMNVWAPAGGGTYYLGAIVDRANSNIELQEDNNWTAGTRVAVGAGPNFVVSSVSAAPSALPGAAVSVTATVCNQGTSGANGPTVEAFFSTDSTITGADFLGGPLPPAPYLAPGACATLTGNATAPSTAGSYSAGIIVDRSGAIPELLEDDNARAGNRVGVGNAPDFVVTAASTVASVAPGSWIPLTVTMCNQGTQSGSVSVELWFSTDGYISINDYFGTETESPTLSPGACSTITQYASAPNTLGTYYLGALADRAGSVVELNEDNNSFTGARVGVGWAPDFYVTSVSTAASALPGAPVTVTATICNQGTQGSSPTVGVYFSSDTSITTLDQFAGVLPPISWLREGTCDVVSGTFNAPPAGSWFAGAIADPFSSIPEIFEDNNTKAGNEIGVGSGPDFYVSAVSTAPSALPGSQVAVTATL
ncbi:MAG TPA: CARDB domain-containing protein, partial [Myxococcales bacterium]|nr:CARDB domain-containing protein [Myxococcales bacterium]